jgi:hypothetical protein
MERAVNFVGFQCAWFACVGGAAAGRAWLALPVVIAVVGWHVARANTPRRALAVLLIAATAGALWDCVPAAAGWIVYDDGVVIERAAPWWIAALWLSFATTLNVSLRWLRGRWLVAALLGAIAGPLCYRAGAALGALSLADPRTALAAQAAAWALLLPALIEVARRFDGIEPTALPAPVASEASGHV